MVQEAGHQEHHHEVEDLRVKISAAAQTRTNDEKYMGKLEMRIKG